ncbi:MULTISPECIES: hypothetical protein [unclassified Roseateles]|uniref:hypothetical protein n=1 Tax=unclassified Roseateles TaxID=2626991 RepID=UPI0006F28748|nr:MULTISPECIES: hypothetical protein [unclassified Roseateles]KQW52209.1 hypothetical protein ASC81_06370 [Pelomonas sp. Root405]KRA78442.1 hypothetical protein ASD88_06375 [Pelomonas sp. Root662]
MDRFIRRADPKSLSVRDLLEARDHYHVHIANLPTVLGTAVGRYRIRLDDANFQDEQARQTGEELGPRTLDNSDFRPWSWPCVLVFVSEWLDRATLARHPELAVPPVLYLPDGRQVRTCPVLVQRREHNLAPADTAVYAADKFGPNFQVHVADQGRTRMGVASAIVEDGACAFALVSRHLTAGIDAGADVHALPRSRKQVIGRTTSRSVDAVPLTDIYPGFSSRGAQLTLDAALVKLDSIAATQSHYLGVGAMGAAVDLSSDKMSLNLLGCPLFTELPGGIRVQGCVHGLFYRHASVGGVDALAEFLIGPRQSGGSVETRPGDSGAVWFWDEAADTPAVPGAAPPVSFRPLAVQWGGHGFGALNAGRSTEFALATGFSSLCKALNVGLVEDWRSGQSRYWGKVGHYNIGYAACFALQTDKARAVFKANATAIGVRDEDIVAGRLPLATQTSKFIALADVPDLVWRRSRGKDKANHFADMDETGTGAFQGKTLMQLWRQRPSSRDPQVWNAFYSSIDPDRKPAHRGALPFRVAQLYRVMVQAVADRELDAYVCAAGVLAHYIGDACQPLHVSHLHHGEADDPDDDEVHAVYETDMLDQAADEVVVGVKQRVADLAGRPLVNGPLGAADAVVQLMRRTMKALPPAEVLEVFNRVRGRGQAAALWAELGPRTMDRMADGAVTLATVWQSAWSAGGGDEHMTLAACKKPVPTRQLKKLYDTKSFAESRWLHEMTLADLS